ncbi:hypothetical protein D029_4819B, partial [Vibrio parahaemolyticus 970107]
GGFLFIGLVQKK